MEVIIIINNNNEVENNVIIIIKCKCTKINITLKKIVYFKKKFDAVKLQKNSKKFL